MPLLCQLQNSFSVLTLCDTHEKAGVNLTSKSAHTPLLSHALILIELSFKIIIQFQKLTPMRPAQFARHCLAFWIV